MFDLHHNISGDRVLVYNRRYRVPGEGMWIEVCHENDKEADIYVQTNRNIGLEVEKDEDGYWRALVCKWQYED